MLVSKIYERKKMIGNGTLTQRFCVTADDHLYYSVNETLVSVYNSNMLRNTVARILYDKHFILL